MPATKRTTVLGIDPGLATAGYGVIECRANRVRLVQCGAISTAAKEPFGQRLATIDRELRRIIDKFKPDTIAIEKLFFAKNAKTALQVGEARGVSMLCAWQSGKEVREFTPLQVKQAVTGYGRADKPQIQKMIKAILGLKEIPKPDDAADALAIAYTGWVGSKQ